MHAFAPSFDIEAPAPSSADAVLFLIARVSKVEKKRGDSDSSTKWVDPAFALNLWSMSGVLDTANVNGGADVLVVEASLPLHVRYELPGCSESGRLPPPAAWAAAIATAWPEAQTLPDGFVKGSRGGRIGCFAPVFLPLPTAHVSCGGDAWIPLPAGAHAWPNAQLFDATLAPPPGFTPVGNAAAARNTKRMSISVILSGILAIFASAASAACRASTNAAATAKKIVHGSPGWLGLGGRTQSSFSAKNGGLGLEKDKDGPLSTPASTSNPVPYPAPASIILPKLYSPSISIPRAPSAARSPFQRAASPSAAQRPISPRRATPISAEASARRRK